MIKKIIKNNKLTIIIKKLTKRIIKMNTDFTKSKGLVKIILEQTLRMIIFHL
jgi:hypothetical protein